MKKRFIALVSWPVLLGFGWLATKLSEQYGKSLDDLQFEFDFE